MRRLGYKPDARDERDRYLSTHRLGAGQVYESVDLSEHVGRIFDQGPTSSCVGHAWAQALRVGMAADGDHEAEYSSPLAAYYWARAESGTQNSDEGTQIRDAAKALSKFGLALLEEWPENFAMVNQAPPHRVYRSAFDRRGMRGYVRIGMGDLAGMRRALSGGAPLVFGITVAESFLDHEGTATIDQDTGPIAGGHALCIVGYEPGRFKIVNSWGSSWGEKGFAWLTERRMLEATDVWMADFDPQKGAPS